MNDGGAFNVQHVDDALQGMDSEGQDITWSFDSVNVSRMKEDVVDSEILTELDRLRRA